MSTSEPPDWALPSWDAHDTRIARPRSTPLEPQPILGEFGPRILAVSDITRAVRDAVRGDERLKEARTNYLGSEVYLSLVDGRRAPYGGDLRQLAVTAAVTNRDLPLLLASGAPDVFHLPDGGPVAQVRTPVAPTRPRPTLAQGASAWRLINHLSLNYLSIADADAGIAYRRREVARLESRIADRTLTVIDGEATPEARADAVLDTKHAAERIGRLKSEITQLERDRARYQQELETYRATVAQVP